MKRRSAPPLYELIRSRSGERTAATREHDDARHVGEPIVESWLRPGRAVQLPVGYLFVAAALVLLLIATGYMVGHSRGYDRAKVVQAEEFGGMNVADESRRPRDPLETRSTQPAGQSTQQQSSARQPAATAPSGSRSGSGEAIGWGPIESDPRQNGVNYFVLATTHPAGALRLAEFCRERGLETYVVSGNNARLRRVIALPGFEAGQRTSPAARAVEASIHRIGESWKNTEPGATDLRDAYPDRFGN